MVTTSGPSSRNLAAIPAPARLRELLRAHAALDILLRPESGWRQFFFVAKWGKHQLATYRDFNGGWFLALFTGPDAAVIKGFDSESPMSPEKRPKNRRWPNLFDGIPKDMVRVKNSHAYVHRDVTYCLWHPPGGAWTIGPVQFPAGFADPDGSGAHLKQVDDKPESYVQFAIDNHQKKVSLAAVRRVYAGEPLTWALLSKLAPGADPARVVKEVEETGYPVAKSLLLKARAEEASRDPLAPPYPEFREVLECAELPPIVMNLLEDVT